MVAVKGAAIAKLTSTDVAGAVLTSVGPKPTSHCVDIHAITVLLSASSLGQSAARWAFDLENTHQTNTSFLPILTLESELVTRTRIVHTMLLILC